MCGATTLRRESWSRAPRTRVPSPGGIRVVLALEGEEKKVPMSTVDQTTSSSTGRLVVVSSSAGGIEALSVFVGTLPANLPAPIVLAQHLDPSRPSSLNTLLQQHISLPVNVITSHTPLQPGEIYVVPANRHVTINDGYAEVQEDHLGHPKPSVDLLLSSAAKAYGQRLIAVILTGPGSNGAVGAIEVKHAGGTVIIQNPLTARFPSLPLALPPTVVDVQVDLARIGPLLYDLLTGTHEPPDDEQGDVLRCILDHVKDAMRIDLRMFKTSSLLQHIRYRMLATNTPTMQGYLDYLISVPAEAGELAKSLLVTYTQFFRDPDAFAYLKGTLLPELVARARERGRTLRFWTAGCATGEEPYSLAMLLADLLGAELSQWSIKIFATDLSEAAISFARRGVYAENSLTGLPPEYKERFFERVDHGYRIVKILRQRVIFGQQDLTRSTPFPDIDLLLGRNVLSYFTSDVQELVLNQFAFSLFPGGYLLLGKTEAVRPPHMLYELVSRDWNVYRCIGKAAPSAQFPDVSALNIPRFLDRSSRYQLHTAAKQPLEQPAALPTFELGPLPRFNELLFRSLPIGMVVIDRSYHIVTANGISRRLLRLPAAATEQDFLHAVPGIPYTEVRTAIDVVFREHSAVTLPEVELDIIAGGTGRFVALSISPIQLDAPPPDLAAISVIDITEQVQTQRRLEALRAEQAQLVDELAAANKRLHEVNNALMKANEELQATNEDMIVSQEEFQAKLKELETTNEELKANFEELEATNEGLQAANEELQTINEQLQVTDEAVEAADEALNARTGELQEENAQLADERRCLVEIIERAPYSIVVLRGPDLRVETFNAHYARQLHGQDVLGRPFSEISGFLWEADSPMVRLANEVYLHDTPRIIPSMRAHVPEAPGETGKKNLAYMLVPAHAADGTVSGVILYATDEAEEREQEANSDMQSDAALP